MRMINNLEQALCVGVLRCAITTLPLVAVACATHDPSEAATAAQTGTLRIPIQQTGSNGAVYRLTGTFQVTGPNGTLSLATDGPSPLEVSVSPGLYRVSLLDGWSLSASSDGGLSFQPVSALLTSTDQLAVRVLANHSDDATFQFVVRSTQGDLELGFGVTTHPRELAGALVIGTADGLLAGYAHTTVDFATYYTDAALTDTSTADGKRREFDSVETATEFFNDPVGTLTSQIGPNLQGGFLSWAVTAKPDATQSLVASLVNQMGPGNAFLSVDPAVLNVPLALDANGYIQDVFFQANVPFQMSADDGSVSGTMSGELRLRNVPVSN